MALPKQREIYMNEPTKTKHNAYMTLPKQAKNPDRAKTPEVI